MCNACDACDAKFMQFMRTYEGRGGVLKGIGSGLLLACGWVDDAVLPQRACAQGSTREPADKGLTSQAIYAMNLSPPVAPAVAVRGGMAVAVGRKAQVMGLKNTQEEGRARQQLRFGHQPTPHEACCEPAGHDEEKDSRADARPLSQTEQWAACMRRNGPRGTRPGATQAEQQQAERRPGRRHCAAG